MSTPTMTVDYQLIRDRLTAACVKYGKGSRDGKDRNTVYEKTIAELREEFGDFCFPAWVGDLSHPKDDPFYDKDVGLDFTKVQLWQLTEDHCDRCGHIDYDNDIAFNEFGKDIGNTSKSSSMCLDTYKQQQSG